MTYTEIRKDIFTVDSSYYLAHCIASDFGMGAGIAVQFQKKFKLRSALQQSVFISSPGSCILINNVFNLITKRRSGGKPTYGTITASLDEMRKLATINDVSKIAMPKIGCGLDRLQWGRVSEIIKETFKGSRIEILVCIW